MRFSTLILALMILCHIPAKAQRERNYIYLFDCTQSMQPLKLWEPAKDALDKTLQKRATEPESHVCIFPFQGTVHPAIRFDSKDYASHRKDINATLDKYIQNRTNTNIVAALKAAEKECDSNMDNRVYLFTDGQQNCDGGPAAVRKALAEWCDKHKNTRLFYIMLDKAAVDQEVIKIAEYCTDIIPIELKNGVIPQISDMQQTTIYANVLELDRNYALQFSEPGDCAVTTDSNDPFFMVEVVGGASHDGTINVRFTPKNGLSVEELNQALSDHTDSKGNYIFNIHFRSGDNDIIIANPDVKVVMANRAMRRLAIAGGITDEITVKPGATWYDSFLWSAAKSPDTLRVDLAPEFNDACTGSSSATFSIESDDDNEDDYTLLFNGTPLSDEQPFTITPGMPAVIEIVFHPDAKDGKRYFKLETESVRNLESINSLPAEDLDEISIRTSYDVDWNPLKTICFWILIAIIAALIAWFLFLRPIIYPAIKANKIIIAGPDSYFRTVRIKGAKQVIFTSRNYKQSALSRLFKGRTIFIRAPHWTSDMDMVPGSKKNVRLRTSGGWMVMPSSTLTPNNEYELIGPDGKKQSDLTLN